MTSNERAAELKKNAMNLSNNCRRPSHFYIDIGNVCNLRCPFCITGISSSDQPQGLMRLADYTVILKKISSFAKLISLYNWGEPFMNPDLIPIIKATADCGIRTHIDTNMSVRDLTPALAEEIILSGLSSMFFSIDGTTQSAYERYRVRGRLDRVMANVNLLVETKQRLSASTPFFGWQFHVHRHNEAEIKAARYISEQIGLPVVFKRLSTPDPGWKSSYHDTDGMFIGSNAWHRQAYNPPGNPDLRGVKHHPNVPHPCRQLFETMVVEWNGDVYPCTVVGGQRYAMGNLIEQTFDKVWNGQRFQQSRAFISNYGPQQNGPSVCENNSCALVQKCAAASA